MNERVLGLLLKLTKTIAKFSVPSTTNDEERELAEECLSIAKDLRHILMEDDGTAN